MTVAKIWDGSSWLTPSGFNRPRIWNGSTWVYAQPKVTWGTYNVPQTRIINVGHYTIAPSKFFPGADFYGYSEGQAGSINNAAFFLWEDTYINMLVYDAGVGYDILFAVKSTDPNAVTNSNWSTMTIGSTSFSRTAATGFSANYYNDGVYYYSEWWWDTSPSGNPFSAIGTDTTVYWT